MEASSLAGKKYFTMRLKRFLSGFRILMVASMAQKTVALSVVLVDLCLANSTATGVCECNEVHSYLQVKGYAIGCKVEPV